MNLIESLKSSSSLVDSLVFQFAPAACIAICEYFKPSLTVPDGMHPELLQEISEIAGIKNITFTTLGADIVSLEDSHELLQRMKQLNHRPLKEPLLFSSCCPLWKAIIQNEFPQLSHLLSKSNSPMVTLSSRTKDKKTVAIMPCIAKKVEAKNSDPKSSNLTSVLTTMEFIQLLQSRGINHQVLESISNSKKSVDNSRQLIGESSGSAQIFGVSGGVSEAVLRTTFEIHTGNPLIGKELIRISSDLREFNEGMRKTTLKLNDKDQIKVFSIHGVSNVRKFLNDLSNGVISSKEMPHYVAGMSCFGGCINGPGQPQKSKLEIYSKALYSADSLCKIKSAAGNPIAIKLYQSLLNKIQSDQL